MWLSLVGGFLLGALAVGTTLIAWRRLGSDPTPYNSVLQALHDSAPAIADSLSASDERRVSRLSLLLEGGVRIAGLEELMQRMKAIGLAWKESEETKRIAFLIDRAVYDFEIAFEAALSGYARTAADAMRDVMEIELLLLDFFIDPDHIDDWLGADRKRLINYYSPGAIRRRIRAADLYEQLGLIPDDHDYQAHSRGVHVSPYDLADMIHDLSRESVTDGFLYFDLSAFEIFEHARRLGVALLAYSVRLKEGSSAAESVKGEMKNFSLAHARTLEYADPFIQYLKAVADEDDEGDSMSDEKGGE